MKASHNSLTAYPVRKWYMKPFNFMAKCQDKLLRGQLNSGVKYFDFRFRYIDGELYAAHGLMTYECTARQAVFMLNKHCEMTGGKIYFRAILEDKPKCERITASSFRLIINHLLTGCNENLILHRVGLKSDWGGHVIYNEVDFFGWNDYGFCDVDAKIKDMQSVSNWITHVLPKQEPFVHECYTYEGLPFPRLMSRLINKYAPDNSMRNFV